MDALDLLKTSDVELLHRADACLRQAGSAVDTPAHNIDDAVRLRLFLEAHSYLSEILRRRAEKTAAYDRHREDRHFWIEIALTILITLLIGVELYFSIHYGRLGLKEGKQQADILEDMKTSTAATAKLQTETLELLRKQEADRAKKPRLVLYLGNTPIDKATVRLTSVAGNPQDMASFDLSVKNLGDAPVSTFQLHALTPAGVGVVIQGFGIYPEFGPQRWWTFQLPHLPMGETTSIQAQVHALKGHAAFKLAFTVDAPEFQTVIPLGSLTVLPPKP